jgi:hypothetical protein
VFYLARANVLLLQHIYYYFMVNIINIEAVTFIGIVINISSSLQRIYIGQSDNVLQQKTYNG